MVMDALGHEEMRRLLDKGDFGEMFRTRLGWDNPPEGLRDGVPLPEARSVNAAAVSAPRTARAVAEKRGVPVWVIDCSETAYSGVMCRQLVALARAAPVGHRVAAGGPSHPTRRAASGDP